MRIDWQMYEDGQLGPEAMREAETALRTDPRARQELEGLRQFRKVVREAALREPVPRKRLEAALQGVAGTTAPRQVRLRPVYLVAAALAAVALAYFGPDLVSGLSTPDNAYIEERKTFTSASAAVEWARDQSSLRLPQMQFASVGQLASAHSAAGWACFDLSVEEGTVHVFVAEGTAVTDGCHVVETADGELYQNEGTYVVSFTWDGFVFNIKGSTADRNLAVAKLVQNEVYRPTVATP